VYTTGKKFAFITNESLVCVWLLNYLLKRVVRKKLSDVRYGCKTKFDSVLSSGISGRQRGSATTETWSRMMPLSQQENLLKSSSTSLKPQAVVLGSPFW